MPNQWRYMKLGDVCSLKGGNAFKSKEFVMSGIPLLRISNIKSRGINIQEAVYLPNAFRDKYPDYFLKNDDIVIAMSGATTGKTGVIKDKDLPLLLNQRVGVFKINMPSLLSNQYLKHLVNSSLFQNVIQIDAIGGAQPNISPKQIESIFFNLPPLKEQQKIAAILSSVDESIDKTEQIIEQTERVKQGLMQQLLTRGIGHTEFKQTEIGEIPKGWKIDVLKNYGDFSNGVSKSKEFFGEGTLFINVKDIASNKTINFKNLARVKLTNKEVKTSRLIDNDLLLIRSYGNPYMVGYPALFKKYTYEEVTHSGFTMKFRPNTDYLNSLFLLYLLKSLRVRKEIYRRGTFSANNNINQKEYGSISIQIPSKDEQHKIAEVISDFDLKLEEEKRKLDVLKNLKKGLMQQLLTGKVRVPVDENEVISQ